MVVAKPFLVELSFLQCSRVRHIAKATASQCGNSVPNLNRGAKRRYFGRDRKRSISWRRFEIDLHLEARDKSTHHWRVRPGDLERAAHQREPFALAIAGPRLLDNYETSAAIGWPRRGWFWIAVNRYAGWIKLPASTENLPCAGQFNSISQSLGRITGSPTRSFMLSSYGHLWPQTGHVS
jgi:hypothetical protein